MSTNNQQISKVLTSSTEYINPFDPTLDHNKLYNITSGKDAAPEIEEFLLNVEKIGENPRKTFITDCIENPARYSLPMKRQKVQSFVNAVKKKKVAVSRKVQEVRLQRDLFGRILALSMNKDIDIKKVLCYPLTPLMLSHIDGSVYKTDNATLLKILEDSTDFDGLHHYDVYIVNGFLFINSLKELPRTFGDLSK